MARLNSYTLLIVALSKFITALPLQASTTVPINVADGTVTEGCTEFHTIGNGDTCISVESEFSISDALFRALNPEINAACTNLLEGEAYCVQTNNSTGTFMIAPGTIVQGCTQFHTVVEDDTCNSVEAEFNITDSLFHSLNPEVGPDCTDLILGLAYCVQTSNSGNSTTSVPSNVSPGTITAGCIEFFTVPTGASCTIVEQETGVSDSVFHALNPQLNPFCSNLIAGEAYCVASTNTPTSSSNATMAG